MILIVNSIVSINTPMNPNKIKYAEVLMKILTIAQVHMSSELEQ